jgi:hypothetical protein
MLPWLALGGYAIFSALLAGAARIWVWHQSSAGFALYFLFPLPVCGGNRFDGDSKQELQSRGRPKRFQGAIVRLETIFLTAFAVFSLVAFSWGRTFMIESHRTRLWGKGALLFPMCWIVRDP